MTQLMERAEELFIPQSEERNALNEVENFLNVFVCGQSKGLNISSPNGEQIALPESLIPFLHKMVYYLLHDKTVNLVPVDKDLTTQQAADILNVSRPFLVKLLEEGKISFNMVGNQRRVPYDKLMDFKATYKLQQRKARKELAQLSQEMGLDDY